MIIYDPGKMLKRIAPDAKIKRLVSGKVSLKRTALAFVDAAADKDVGVLNKKAITDVANKTVRGYQERIAKATVAAGFDRAAGSEVKEVILDDPKQLIQRVQNEIVLQVSAKIREQYGDEEAEWLPSEANEPDPEHALNYGKTFKISEGINGEIPGERIGCLCGMRILTKQTRLDLE